MNKKNIPCFNLFHHIINNEPIPKDALKGLVENFPEKFLVLLINALKKYTISESKDSLFSSFMNHSKKIPQILIQYGLFLSEIGRFEEAASVLEKAKENEPGDPSVIFYLISVYLRTDNMEKVKNLIIYAENKFSNLSPVISRIEFIKKKIFF
jgi:tetratricopeptide (TPR) repeat protein